MRVLVSGGGTAGHIYPALTVGQLVSRGGHEVVFAGVPGSLEERLAAEAGMEFVAMPASGWDRARPWTLLTGLATALASFARMIRLLGRRRIDVVAGFGGYVSLPAGLAAVASGVPLVLHEQNSVPGLVNKVLGRWARRTCVTYEASIPYLPRPERAIVTGDPVRVSVLSADRDAGRRSYGVADDEVLLLVFGGSRGARHLNEALVDLYPSLREMEGLRVVHVTGRQELEAVSRRLRDAAGTDVPWWSVLGYVEGMGDLMAAADLVVCRAGATTLAEVSVLGKPSVLVPYPYATDDHQTRNAEPFVDAGAALLVADADLDREAFRVALEGLLSDATRREAMSSAARSLGHPDAAASVAAVLADAADGAAVR